jgi:hypothetical protein
MDSVMYVVRPLAEVRASIAAAVVHDDAASAAIGAVHLRPRQLAAAQRLAKIISERGGAMLAEPVGTGKTYTALAVASRYEHVLIAAPAALRAMWLASLERTGVRAEVTTHEALSRGAGVHFNPGFIIVDEAHRLRNPATRRYAALAEIARRAHVLLVTATPLQNRRDDLAAQLALFAGRGAWSMTDEELASYIVRGAPRDDDDLPSVSGPHRLVMATNDDCFDGILALPPPVPPRGESIAAQLLAYSLIHQWSSSRAALVAALRRRRSRGLALLAALEAGRHPTRDELAAWTHLGDAMQLAFPEMVVAAPPHPHRPNDAAIEIDDLDALAIAVDRHNAGIEALLAQCGTSPDPDSERAAVLRGLIAAHPGERIIAFCQYAETVNVLHRQMRGLPRIAALTAAGGRIASGRISRDQILRQFAPPTVIAQSVRDVERIDLLLTTDLLSEGLDLQQASVVVHLDLPWNPARLDQRVGRARRLESAHGVVTVYALAPPTPAERLLRIEERLRGKLRLAGRTVGISGHIIPGFSAVADAPPAVAEQRGAIDAALRAWATDGAPRAYAGAKSDRPPIIAAVRATAAGYLALVHGEFGALVIADTGGGIQTVDRSPATLLAAINAASGSDARVDPSRAAAIIPAIERWLLARGGESIVDLERAAATRPRRATLLRVSQAVARAPRHRRAEVSVLATAARLAATAPLAEGAERILDVLAHAPMPDEAWLRSVAAFGELNVRPSAARRSSETEPARVIAVILFQPPDVAP